ncbi:MAG: glycosyltransferase family 39 protein [Actinobacteria bacterium]|nr:glycosyltransferase family 39 protein [Actinomycetota bacterium]MBV8394661.1 glycosyltransferase family 39 protein [Actinomycetota bacterium]MBV8599856.1 glycosyltransferase family 39 protein [Actinomycetota bacterium]
MSRSRVYALLAAACILPRAVALVHERAGLLGAYVEKSDILAQVYLRTGTFGYVPGHPSANTQPLYGWFLIVVYWLAGRHWWSMGTAQILIAFATALLVYEIGRRFLSRRAGVIAALIATLHPYVVWHDIHVNREILDQVLGAAMVILTLIAASRRSVAIAAALGVVSGAAILSNTRLVVLPFVLGAYLLWRGVGWTGALLVPVLAFVVMLPWLVRNDVEVGCFTITTDARALWKANNMQTYGLLQKGIWIDSITGPPGRPLTPQEARDHYLHGQHVSVNECAQQSWYEHMVIRFWEHHPGEKAKLMVQSTRLLWSPWVTADTGIESSGAFHAAKHIAEPAYVIPLYILAVIGLFVVPLEFRVLALAFLVYETLAAWVFAGTTRYRVPWDFVLALLAGAAISRWWPLRRASQYR